MEVPGKGSIRRKQSRGSGDRERRSTVRHESARVKEHRMGMLVNVKPP
jgi:protein subunit release factor A